MTGPRLLAFAPFLLAAASCAVVSPPPMRMPEEPVVRPEPGAISLSAAGGVEAGVFLKAAAGGEGRLSVQATREMGFEASGGGGHVIETEDVHGAPKWLGFGRLGGVYRPTRLDWVTLRFGMGASGADTGLTCATTDVGVSFGWTFRNRVRPYGGVSLALSAPLDRGPWIGNDDDTPRKPATTFWLGGNLGLAVRVAGPFEVGIEGYVDGGRSFGRDGDGAILWGGVGVLRYTFPAPR